MGSFVFRRFFDRNLFNLQQTQFWIWEVWKLKMQYQVNFHHFQSIMMSQMVVVMAKAKINPSLQQTL
jgi:hypothetical protein